MWLSGALSGLLRPAHHPRAGSAIGKQQPFPTQHEDRLFTHRNDRGPDKETCPRSHSWQVPSPHSPLHSPAPGASLPHKGQGGGANLVDTLGVFQPGEVHLLHVTRAASTSAAWERGRWTRPAAPAEHLDITWGQKPHGLCPQPGWQQPQLIHSGHGQWRRGINHSTRTEEALAANLSLIWHVSSYQAGGPGQGSDDTEEMGTVCQPYWVHCLVGDPSSIKSTHCFGTLSPSPAVSHPSSLPAIPQTLVQRQVQPRPCLREHPTQVLEPTQKATGHVQSDRPIRSRPRSWPPWNLDRRIL